MSVEWFQAVLGLFFVAVWVVVGQILATDRQDLSSASMMDNASPGKKEW
jgi:hypothetical protein